MKAAAWSFALIAVALAFLWVATVFAPIFSRKISVDNGTVFVESDSLENTRRYHRVDVLGGCSWEVPGIRYDSWHSSVEHGWLLSIHLLLPIILSTCALVICVVVFRYRAFPSGTCSKCGYDTRCSHRRCPECGSAI
jgi:hypothetical protein